MSSLKCYKCSTAISEIIQYCPNCSARIIHNTDLANIDVKELWLNAYKSHYKSGNNMLIDAVNMYAYIIAHFPGSEEAGYARNQLNIIGVDFSMTPDGKVVITDRSSDQHKSSPAIDEAVPEEVVALCSLLQLPDQSTPAEIAAKYAKMKEAWTPDRYIAEPDKFFEAKQITERLEKAYAEASKCIEFSKVVPSPEDQIEDEEFVVTKLDGVRSWDKESPGIAIGTFLGSFVLTNKRLVFLSSGGSGVFSAGAIVGGALGGVGLGILAHAVGANMKTRRLNFESLTTDGSYDIHFANILSYEVKRRLDTSVYFTVCHQVDSGNKKHNCLKIEGSVSKSKWETICSAIDQHKKEIQG